MNEKLLIVDGNSILNRAFYAIKGPRMLSRADGTPTNAVYGFINILNKYIEEEKPEYLGVAFDMKAKTFRHNMFEGYKAGRKGMPDELAAQLPIVKQVLWAMNIAVVEVEGLEADDLIGIYSKSAEDNGMQVSILTGDRDSLQLVSDRVSVIIPATQKGQTLTTKYTPAEIMDKYGVEPRSLIEVKALMGDPSDNIPGVKGVGEKTALELIRQFKNLDNLYDNLSKLSKERLRLTLEENREMAYLSRILGTIVREKEGLSDIALLRRRPVNRHELLKLFRELEFSSLIKKMGLDCAEASKPCRETVDEAPSEIIETESALERAIGELLKLKKAAMLPILEKSPRVGGNLTALALGSSEKVYFIGLSEGLSEQAVATRLKRLFAQEELTLISHNIKEIYTWALSYGADIRCRLFDIMTAEYLIDALSNAYGIPALVQKYTGRDVMLPEAPKARGRQTATAIDLSQWVGPMNMAISAFWLICERQSEILTESEQNGLYYDIELPLSLVLGSMEYHGFRVDRQNLEKYGERLERRIASLEQTIHLTACEEFNINSPRQLGIILFEKLGLKPPKKTKTGYSTDAEVLAELSDRHEIIPLILEYRQLVKLKSTYAEGLAKVIHPDTGRIHSSFNQTVTATGRISSTEPNLQNIPVRTELGREIRRAFVPQDGYVFVDADYSQIELRVLAHITGDEMLQKAFVDGVDIHALTASQVFRVPLEKVTPDMRRSAKAVNFGIVYGISDFSLARDLGVTKKEAARYIEGYLNTYPRVREYMENTVKNAQEKGYVETMFHRIRHIPELKSPNFQVRSFGKRVAMNTPVQGSAADIIKIAMVRVWRELKEKGLKSRLILQVHDELLVETLLEELDQVKEIVKCGMEEAVKLDVPLIADVSTGTDWYEAK